MQEGNGEKPKKRQILCWCVTRCKQNAEDSIPSVISFRSSLEKKHVLCLIIPLFNPQPTKERNWENEEEL